MSSVATTESTASTRKVPLSAAAQHAAAWIAMATCGVRKRAWTAPSRAGQARRADDQ